MGSRMNNADVDVRTFTVIIFRINIRSRCKYNDCDVFLQDGESITFTTSKSSIPKEKPQIVRPLSRKDIFYSGSVVNLPEYQSQKSIANYRQSVISLPKSVRGDVKDTDVERASQRK